MKYINWIIVLLVLAACQQKIGRQTTGADALAVFYTSPFRIITIEKGQLTVIRKIHHYPADRPMVATPDSVSTELEVDGLLLPNQQLDDLRNLLRNNGFFDLEDSYGAPEGQRYYPYSIRVVQDGQEKTVAFRSNPAYDKAPEAYRKVEAFLVNLSASIKPD